METSLILLLPTILFVITIALFFILRAKDQQETKLPMVRKMAEQTIGEIEKINAQFRQDVTDMEVQVADKENEIKEHIQTITRQIKELDSYSDDLARLRSSMSTYQEALAGLAKLTSDADGKIQQVESDVNRLSEVRQTIEGFRSDLEEFKADIEDEKISVEELERNAVDRVEAAGKAVSAECDSYLGRIDASLNNANQTIQQLIAELHDESTNIINDIGDRASEQMDLANKINLLLEQKNSLEVNLASLNEQVEEKRTVNDELAELSRQQTVRIEEVRNDIERLEEEKRAAETALSEFEEKASSELEAAIEETFIPEPEPTPEFVSEPVMEPVMEPEPVADSESVVYSEPVVDPEQETVSAESEFVDPVIDTTVDIIGEPEGDFMPEPILEPEPESAVAEAGQAVSTQDFENSDLGDLPEWEEGLAEQFGEKNNVSYTGEDEEIVFD